MLSTPLICCSMGVETDCSTVCASAPKYVVDTCTSGGAMAGNWETGRLTMLIAPTITVRMEITMATMGRLMKNFDIVSLQPWAQPDLLERHLAPSSLLPPRRAHRVSAPRSRSTCFPLDPPRWPGEC